MVFISPTFAVRKIFVPQNPTGDLHIPDILGPDHQDQQDSEDPGGEEDVHRPAKIHDFHGPADDRSLSDLCGDGGCDLLHHLRAAHSDVLLPLSDQGEAGLPHGLDRDDDSFRIRSAPDYSLYLLCCHNEVYYT